jgi:hemin uptake protein HemP
MEDQDRWRRRCDDRPTAHAANDRGRAASKDMEIVRSHRRQRHRKAAAPRPERRPAAAQAGDAMTALDPKSPAAHVPMARSVARIASDQLLKGRREIIIQHGREEYRLRVTAAGKLILTK